MLRTGVWVCAHAHAHVHAHAHARALDFSLPSPTPSPPRVNVYKDKVKNHGGLPPLPQHDAIKTALSGSYSTLR